MQDISESYADVLSGGATRVGIAHEIVNVLARFNKPVHVNMIFRKLKTNREDKSFVRSCLKVFEKNGVVSEIGESLNESYRLIAKDLKVIDKVIIENFGSDDLPSATKKHFEQYGFNELVANVAKQITHEGIVVKEYGIDRLWIGRYIDFLELAKEYTSFRLSDNQIASKKASDIKKQSKIKK